MCPHGRRHHTGGMHGHPNLPDISIDEDAPPSYRVYHRLRRVMRAQKRLLMRKLGEKDAHLGQAFILWVLSDHEGMSPSDLADALNVKRPTMTVMLKKMERAGLIERRMDDQDQRYVRVQLTPAGRELHATLRETHAEVVEATVGSLSENDLGELERLLELVEMNLTEEQDA